MSTGPSRRRVLAVLASAVGVGAGCTGEDAPELRVRNFSETTRTLRVEVARDGGETVHAAEYELGPNEQATEKEVYDTGTYVVTATSGGEITASEETAAGKTTGEIDVDRPDGILTHVTVQDDGVSIGRIAP